MDDLIHDRVAVEVALEASGVGLFELELARGRARLSAGCRALLGLAPDEVSSLDRIGSLVHPEDRSSIASAAAALAPEGEGELCFVCRIVRPDGAVRWLEVRGRAVFAGDDAARRPIRFTGATVDVTEREEREAIHAPPRARSARPQPPATEHTARSRTEQLQTLTAAFARAARPAEVIEAAVALGGSALGATGGALAFFHEDRGEFELVAGPGISPRVGSDWQRYASEPQLPASRAVATRCACYSHTRAEYVAHDPRFAAVAEALGIEADATLPLIVGDRVLGVLSFVFASPQAFDADDDAYLRTVAEQCAQALERARLYELEREARQEIARSHAEAQAAVERVQLALAAGAIVGTWDWDLPTDTFTVDERFAENFGIDPALGRTGLSLAQVIAMVHPDDLPGLRAAIDAAIARGGPYSHQYRVCGRDGVPSRFPGVLIDVERRRELEAERDRATQLLRAFVDAVPGAVYAKDLEGRMLVANRGVTELVGKPLESYLGKTDLEFLDNKVQAAAVMATDRRIMESGRAEVLEEEVNFPDGRRTIWLSTKEPFRDEEGRVIGLVGSSIDITARKDAEAALREADRRRNEFLAMLGHELRNPLAPIANAVHLLERSSGKPEKTSFALQIIRRQTAHMARLVDDLLEVSRVTQGRIELRKEDILVASAVLSAVESVRPLARERQQSLEVDAAQDLDVIADPARLTQVIANLLNNASKYTQPGGHIAIRARAADETWAEIVVADDGPGIEPELLPHIFDLFSQGPTTIDRARGGLGLGLALVKRLVELHGGSVKAESAGAGRGATFTVRLPRPERRAASQDAGARSPPALAPTSILVVDDNVDAVESLAMVLEADGHTVELAYDGEQALSRAQRSRPRVVLLDLGLPKLDGWAVARAMRADPALRDTVIVALSGYGQSEDRERSRRAGFDAHLLKPIDLPAIYGALGEVMGRDAR